MSEYHRGENIVTLDTRLDGPINSGIFIGEWKIPLPYPEGFRIFSDDNIPSLRGNFPVRRVALEANLCELWLTCFALERDRNAQDHRYAFFINHIAEIKPSLLSPAEKVVKYKMTFYSPYGFIWSAYKRQFSVGTNVDVLLPDKNRFSPPPNINFQNWAVQFLEFARNVANGDPFPTPEFFFIPDRRPFMLL